MVVGRDEEAGAGLSSGASLVYEAIAVTKWYRGSRRPANDGISLGIAEGEVFGILGANGAGKTTFVDQLAGLTRPSRGAITIYGRDVGASEALITRTVGYMPQSAFALNNLTVDEAIAFAGRVRGLAHRVAAAEADRLVDRLGLDPSRRQVARRLSGGQRRLLQLAVTMAASPPVLLLDEPTGELDPHNRERVWSALRDANERLKTTIVFITHDPVEAEKVIDRVAIMRDGRIVACGRPAELKRTVSRLLRLEVTVHPGASCPDLGGPWHHVDGDRWRTYIERQDAASAVARLEADVIEEFRLYSPTLEDLYFHYAAAR
jgi:ABC-2 type transport system ATP-binding protein